MTVLRRASALLALTVAVLLAAGAPLYAESAKEGVAPEAATGRAGKSAVHAARHMVVAANPHAADAGRAVLRAGGSAIDAAIAAQLVLNLVEPQSSGIGGGAFLLYWNAADATMHSYDGRETAPASARPDMFLTAGGDAMGFRDAVVSPRAVGVPGLLRMLAMAHQAHGALPWADLFRPAIDLAEAGFAVSSRLHSLLQRYDNLAERPATRAYFLTADGAPLPVDARLGNPALAATLRTLARDGADAFYAGAIADDIVAAVNAAAGGETVLTAADLAGYRAVERTPLCRPYRAYRVCGMGPPSSGGIATLQMLALLERFDLPALAPGSAAAAHLLAEAGRLAFADRDRYVADADVVPVPVTGLLDSDYLTRRTKLIDPTRAMGQAAPGDPGVREGRLWGDGVAVEAPSTTHLVAVDGAGNVASMTSSIEHAFGSQIMVRGFLLNNQLTDFSFHPARDGAPVANRAAAGKRPRSSMAPTIVLGSDGRPALAVGSPGGSRIIGYVVHSLVAVLDWDLDVQAAVDLPHVVNRNGATELEAGTPAADLAEALRAMGHEVRVDDMNSGLHGVAIGGDGLTGGADPRREGAARGD